MPLNPDIEAYLDLVEAGRASANSCAMHALTPEQARREFDQSSQLMNLDVAEVATIQSFDIPARDGHPLAARLYADSTAADSARGALLYFHGGGYVVGSLDSHDGLCRRLAAESNAVVIAVAYRLAPQWRFPTAFQDAEDAWHWLAQQAEGLGLDPQRLAIGGDSVGGSLAAAVAQAVAEAPVEALRPCLQLLFYPVMDASRTRGSHDAFANGYLLEKATLEWFYGHYQRTPEDRLDRRFSPLLGAVSARLAPTWLLLAEYDPLLDEGLAYAAHLLEAGAAVELQVLNGLTHDFMRMEAVVEEVYELQRDLGRRLERWLGRPGEQA